MVLFRPMWQEGIEAIGSMGDDTPVAVLSNLPRPLFHYFYQRFAEVIIPRLGFTQMGEWRHRSGHTA